jgi:hypothetical protein
MRTIDLEALPALLPVAKAIVMSGINKTEIYNRLKTGEIEARKMRRSTLVVTASLLAFVASLPPYRSWPRAQPAMRNVTAPRQVPPRFENRLSSPLSVASGSPQHPARRRHQ